jgi:hypothetical protein
MDSRSKYCCLPYCPDQYKEQTGLIPFPTKPERLVLIYLFIFNIITDTTSPDEGSYGAVLPRAFLTEELTKVRARYSLLMS